MRKIHQIFQPLKPLREDVVHWSQVHGNLLLKAPDRRMLKAFTVTMHTLLIGAPTKSNPPRKNYFVVFDRSFLVAKIYQVLLQLSRAGIEPIEIKLLLKEAYSVLCNELLKQENEGEHESSN